MYLEILKAQVSFESKEALLRQVKHHTAGTSIHVEKSLVLWREARGFLRDRRDVGLETIPGILLPTPTIIPEGILTTSEGEPTNTASDGEFVVNTVYTKPPEAKAVVGVYLQLVKQYSKEESPIVYVDAGAGAGSLLLNLPASHRIGIDLYPAHPEVIKMDYFQCTQEDLMKRLPHHDDHVVCVISNPPFAERSRGDYSGIVKFINHSFEHLQAAFIGVIVPSKFCRQRVWRTLGMNPSAKLLARFVLPNDSFYDPSSATCRNISATFLFFGLDHTSNKKVVTEMDYDESSQVEATQTVLSTKRSNFRIEGNRNKGDFPWLRTAEFVEAISGGLNQLKINWNILPETVVLSTDLNMINEATAQMELHVLLNPKQPLSLVNCISRRIPEHSLGWLSLSAKPPIALAMCNLAMNSNKKYPSGATKKTSNDNQSYGLAINTMCGEGTIELESRELSEPFFLIAGDKSEEAVYSTASRLGSLQECTIGQRRKIPLIDFVIWDAQRLPLRSEIADIFLGDLPFGGSQTKKHQEPSLSGMAVSVALSYRHIMAETIRVLRCGGRGSFVSADTKALSYAALYFNGRLSVAFKTNVNLGGLPAKLMVLEKSKQSSKDLTIWMEGNIDHSDALHRMSMDACEGYKLDDLLQLQEDDKTLKGDHDPPSLVVGVERTSTYAMKEKDVISHCYRFRFDSRVSNGQAKSLEKRIRFYFDENKPDEMHLTS
jgi:predicted RNA methylase